MSLLSSGRLARLLRASFGAGVLILAGAGVAAAQYYPPDPYRDPPPRYRYRPAPPPEYGYDEDRYYRPRRVRMGTVCVTSRGSCQRRNYSAIGARCFCIIPGFGKKHGNVQY